MNDKFLIGNEMIEQAIHTFNQDNADVNYFNVFEAIRRRMNEDGHLILPVEYEKNGNMNWLSIQGANDGAALAAFTSEEEAEKGQKSDLISHHIEAVFLSAINTGADGILLNPWGECVFLSMEDLEKILAANRAAGDSKKLHVIKDDITKFKGDVIVNAANNTLFGGSGVDGAIHRAAGEALLEECKTLHGCETGQAKMTKGYNLPASFVIHTVGPIYSGKDEDDEMLRSCYRNSLNLAMENNLHTIAFPSISTGVYGYPVGEAAFSACDEMYKWFEEHPDYDIHVTMVCFDQETFERYQTAASMLNAYRHADKYLAAQEKDKTQKIDIKVGEIKACRKKEQSRRQEAERHGIIRRNLK